MANILQVTTPSVNTDNRIIDNQEARNHPENPRIQNPVDPSRVVRADGQEEGKTGTATGEGTYHIIDYESNYGAFIQKLGDGLELPKLLEQLLFRDAAGFIFSDEGAVGSLVERLLSSIQVDSPEELLEFFMGQQAQQAKFTGALFDGLRGVLSQNPSESLKDAVMAFLKGYNDYSSGHHLLQQMHSLTDDIGRLLLTPFKADYQQLLDSMNWAAPNGDTAENAALLNGRLIPFLSSYISRTHDYGAVRDAVMLFILHAVKYENGGEDRLLQLFDRMAGNREFERLFKGDAQADLNSALGALGKQDGGSFADVFSSLLLRGANGEAGLEHIQQFYNIMNGMLLNESVYLPLLHILVPFQYQGKDVMSEIWADPDAEKERDENGRKIKMFFKFNIQNLGKFDMILALQDRQVDMQIYVPPVLTRQMDTIQDNIAGILKKNGLDLNRLLVREKTGDIRLADVFPEIREKERTINVRI